MEINWKKFIRVAPVMPISLFTPVVFGCIGLAKKRYATVYQFA